MKLKSIIPVFLTIGFLLILSFDIQAAGMGGGNPPPPCGGPLLPPCPVPLDNNILLLLVAGAFYGGYRIYNALKKNPA